MTNSLTREPLRVIGDRCAPGCVMVPVSQLGAVQQLLDDHQIPYWVDEDYFSFDGDPDVAFVNIGRDVDPALVQVILDRAA